VAPGTDPKDRVCLLELSHYLSDQLLRDTDQMSMAHSLEVRVPLLDDPVVRLALALPAAVRLEPGKGLLVKAAGLNRPAAKRCFTLPFDAWMRGPLKEVVREGLLSEDLPFRHLVPAAMRQRVWTAFELGKTHWSRPWAIAVLRLWPAANGFQWQ
jgi:asparagine synthase (glutamine-hydrolysing)